MSVKAVPRCCGCRVLLALILRGLTQHVSYTMAADDPERASRGGWVFNTPDPVFGKRDLRCPTGAEPGTSVCPAACSAAHAHSACPSGGRQRGGDEGHSRKAVGTATPRY